MDNHRREVYPSRKIKLFAQWKFLAYVSGTMIRHYGKYILMLITFLLLIVIFWRGITYFIPYKPSVLTEIEATDHELIFIPKASTFSAILDTLESNRLIGNRNWALFLGKIFGFQTRIKAGQYAVPRSLNTFQILHYLCRAPQIPEKLTIPEGLSYTRIIPIIAKKLSIPEEELLKICTNKNFLQKFDIPDSSVEGYLRPETYFFLYTTSAEEVIGHLIKEQQKIFQTDSIRHRMEELKMSMHQILTLASIIEAEAILDEEKPTISSVYWNRLKKGMRLQADPTIQYIIEDGPRRLLYKDLQIQSPYNTYIHKGLPPGPINNPGLKSIMAALYPEDTDYLYFVAAGDGSHNFSKSLKEHNLFKKKFNRIRKKVYGY